MLKPYSLRFTPRVWAKIAYMLTLSDNELGGFGITDPENGTLVTDFALVEQEVSKAGVEFEAEGIADFFDRQVDAGLQPKDFARIWIHTHPTNISRPSSVDERTFEEVFGECDWAAMVVIPRGGAAYGVVQYGIGPTGQIELPIMVDYRAPFAASDHEAWKAEFDLMVTERIIIVKSTKGYSPTKTGKAGSGTVFYADKHDGKGSMELGLFEDGTGFMCPRCYHLQDEDFLRCPGCGEEVETFDIYSDDADKYFQQAEKEKANGTD